MFRFVARVRLYGLFRQIRSGTGQSDQRRSRFSASSRTRGAEEAVYQGGAAVAAGVVALSEFLNYEQRLEAAYFEAVRTLLTRIEGKGKMSLREINARINELLKQSIKSDGVINLFSDVEEEFSLFDPKFLEEISRMKERNFAVELLRKLIAE